LASGDRKSGVEQRRNEWQRSAFQAENGIEDLKSFESHTGRFSLARETERQEASQRSSFVWSETALAAILAITVLAFLFAVAMNRREKVPREDL
jgi:hypothetical protein